MGKRAILLLLALVPMASAQTRITVSQLDELLANLPHQSDGKTARKLAGYELTERLTSAKLTNLTNRFHGKRTSEALTALADSAAFLNLPASDLLDQASPDKETRNQMFSRLVGYVIKTVPKLPNLYALRTTSYFDIASPKQLRRQDPQDYPDFSLEGAGYALGPADPTGSTGRRLLFAGVWSRKVTYRDGQEVDADSATTGDSPDAPTGGLTTNGEFGPILSVVTHDLVLSDQVSWGGWEKGASGPLAVFKYRVTWSHSHYAVGAVNNDGPLEFPAYHGEITVEPETGTILRITVVADRQPTMAYPAFESDILVEYAPVNIGGNSYICPVKAVAMTKELGQEADAKQKPGEASLMVFVNDVTFTQYHMFRAESRILTGSDVAK
jgi:hypothetical protein